MGLHKREILHSNIYFLLFLSEMMEAFLMGWWKKMTKIKQKGKFLSYLKLRNVLYLYTWTYQGDF